MTAGQYRKVKKEKEKKNVDTNGRISLRQIQIYHFRPVWPLWPVGSVTCRAMERPIHISFCEKDGAFPFVAQSFTAKYQALLQHKHELNGSWGHTF